MQGRSALIAVLTLWLLLCVAGPAYAYDESTSTLPTINEANCGPCHQPWSGGVWNGVAVHSNYSTVTKSCSACHTVHKAPVAGKVLLPGATIQATCFTCHDGTQGRGVYGAITARGLSVGASHTCEATNLVPGGNGQTGGDATMPLGGRANVLTCVDCHSPHGANLVATFTPERFRYGGWPVASRAKNSNLLLRNPGHTASSTPVYGSDWCGCCHKGRLSGGPVHNHPVDSKLTTTGPRFYEQVAVLTTDSPTSTTTTGTLGQTNRGYLMPVPRTVQQQGHAPICQQCHEDSRNVGTLDPSGAPADAATWSVTSVDGWVATDNPRFQNFPHETQNTKMLVEINDDLCTNCHPVGALP